MAAILGFETGQLAAKSNRNPALIGTLNEDGVYMVSAGEVQKIHRRYKQLSSNRTDHVMAQRRKNQKRRTDNRMGDANKTTGHPELNPKSQQIFEKMLANNKVQIGHSYEDYLMNRGKQYDERRQQ